MLDHLLDAVLDRHTAPGESEAQVLARIRLADSQLTGFYSATDVTASAAYADPLIRAAYQLRYQPHYVLQIGDLLRELEGDEEVAELFSRPQLRHVALCGGPAPEPIALAVLHRHGGGSHLHSTVIDQGASHWRDCWPTSARVATAFSNHPRVEIDGMPAGLAHQPTDQECAALAQSQVLTLMNALNELMQIGAATLEATLAARLAALPSGSLVLVSDQAAYRRSAEGIALIQRLLSARGARFLITRTSPSEAHVMENRFQLVPRLQQVYGQPAGQQVPPTRYYRIWNRQLQLAALMC
jgi:hypothetical protein